MWAEDQVRGEFDSGDVIQNCIDLGTQDHVELATVLGGRSGNWSEALRMELTSLEGLVNWLKFAVEETVQSSARAVEDSVNGRPFDRRNRAETLTSIYKGGTTRMRSQIRRLPCRCRSTFRRKG